MPINAREYRGERDYDRVVDLLRESYRLLGPWFSWGPEHWHLLHTCIRMNQTGWEKELRLFETDEGKLVGVVLPEEPGSVYLAVHPEYREVEPQMLDWVEQLTDEFSVFACGWDERRLALFAERGYTDKGAAWNHYRFRFDGRPIPVGQLPAGYKIRTLDRQDPAEGMRLAVCEAATWGAGTGEPNLAIQLAVTRTVSYRADLSLVVEAPDGSVAAFCTVWFDPVLRIGVFEPVGTHKEHRKLGLAKAMMWEAFRRTEALGATAIYVTAWATSVHANALYRSLGAVHFATDMYWEKEKQPAPQ